MADKLNEYCRDELVSYLSMSDLLAMENVSTLWRKSSQRMLNMKTSLDINEELRNGNQDNIVQLLARFGNNIKKLIYAKRNKEVIKLEDFLKTLHYVEILNLKAMLMTPANLMRVGTTFTNVQELSLRVNYYVSCSLLGNLIYHLDKLRSISISGHICSSSNTSVCILDLPQNVEDIRLESCLLIPSVLTNNFSQWTALKKIRLDDCRVFRSNIIETILKNLPNLQEFAFNYAFLEEPTRRLYPLKKPSNLRCLTLICNPLVDDKMLRFIYFSCPRLEKISIGFLPYEGNIYNIPRKFYLRDDLKIQTITYGLRYLLKFTQLSDLTLYGFNKEQLNVMRNFSSNETLKRLRLVSRNEALLPIATKIYNETNLTHLTVLGCRFKRSLLKTIAKTLSQNERKEILHLKVEESSFSDQFLHLYVNPLLHVRKSTTEKFCHEMEEYFLK